MRLDEFQGVNAGYVLELYERYRQNPESVDPETRKAFESWTPPSNDSASTQPISDIANIQGIWTARTLEMSDLRRGSHTRLTLEAACRWVSRKHGVEMFTPSIKALHGIITGQRFTEVEAQLGRVLTAHEKANLVGGEHAGGWETSFMLAQNPELVEPIYPQLNHDGPPHVPWIEGVGKAIGGVFDSRGRDSAHVREIFEAKLARPLGLSVDEAAAAVIRLANTHMAGAIRMVSLSRGYDPRDFTLFAFGGAGPLHAVALAQELSLPEVLVPARPGLTNALGCLVADLRQDFVNTLNVPLDGVDMASVHATLAAQRERGIAINAEEQSEIVETQVLHGADMQFRGQTHLIRVTLPRADVSREEMQALFETAYFNRFQVRLPEIKAVLVNLVTSVIGRRRPFPMAALIDAGERAVRVEGAIIGERNLFARAAWQTAPVFDRVKLPIGARIAGPAIVQQIDATTLIEPGSAALVDEIGSLRIAVGLPA
jgi:hypothetical protein